MDMIPEFLTQVLEPLRAVSMTILGHLPSMGLALLLLLVGSWACMWVRIPVDFVFRAARIDDHARRIGLGGVLARLGLGPSLTNLTRTVVSAIVFLGFFVAAAEAMNLPVVREYLRRTLGFLPTLAGVVMVLGGGLFVGEIIGRIVHRAADANHVRGGEALMRITHGMVVIFSGIMAFGILGVDVIGLVMTSTTLVMASVGLGLAIAFGVAFGMAGRDMADRWLRDLTPTAKSAGNGHEPRIKMPMKVAR